MCHSVDGLHGRIGQIVDWTRWVSQVLIVPMVGVAFMLWLNHESRIDEMQLNQAVVEGNRFSSEDGKEVWSAIAAIEASKASRTEVPTPEVIAFMNRIDQKLNQIEARQIEHITNHNGGR